MPRYHDMHYGLPKWAIEETHKTIRCKSAARVKKMVGPNYTNKLVAKLGQKIYKGVSCDVYVYSFDDHLYGRFLAYPEVDIDVLKTKVERIVYEDESRGVCIRVVCDVHRPEYRRDRPRNRWCLYIDIDDQHPFAKDVNAEGDRRMDIDLQLPDGVLPTQNHDSKDIANSLGIPLNGGCTYSGGSNSRRFYTFGADYGHDHNNMEDVPVLNNIPDIIMEDAYKLATFISRYSSKEV
jgi:hypothetical protein